MQTILKYGKPLDMRYLERGIEWRKEIAADQKLLAGLLKGQCVQLHACPVCESSKITLYVTVFDYPYDKCESCGHIFCATPPQINSVNNLYNSDSELKSVQSKIYLNDTLFLKRVETIAHPKVEFVTDILSSLQKMPIGKWIDIGSGGGEVLLAAAHVGWDALGIESDLEECNYAKSKGLNVINEYLTGDAFGRLLQGAQVVSLFNVLEHIPDPKQFLSNIARVLDDGLLIFEVPRHPSLSSLSSEMFCDMACRHIYPPDHLHIFSERSLNLLLEGTDFMVVGKWYFGQDFFDLICSAGANQGIATNSVWAEIAAISSKVQQVIDQEGLADTVIVVAYKGKK